MLFVAQNHVTIVDTPGVGESPSMTNRLFEYLPKAIAFIYVLNSANAGGIQDDKVRVEEDTLLYKQQKMFQRDC